MNDKRHQAALIEYSLKQKMGAVIYDVPRFMWAMRPSSNSHWVSIRNRNEQLSMKDGGVRCDWRWTSDLHVSNVFPNLGRMLMKRALRDWPIQVSDHPGSQLGEPTISFIIGHRGSERLPHLMLTLKSIAAQRRTKFECIVVEQSPTCEVKNHLPSWVKYVHTPLSNPVAAFCRSWAFNVGARNAQGEVLVLHDNDMLIPQDYASEILKRRDEGSDVINLKRFIFYLTEKDSKEILTSKRSITTATAQVVVQNLEAGGSVAISRTAYFAIGAFDEAFVGWGGEDNEFWERAQTLRVWPYGYLPIVHLWHAAQPGKHAHHRSTAALFEARSKIPVSQRVAELAARKFGNSVDHFLMEKNRSRY